ARARRNLRRMSGPGTGRGIGHRGAGARPGRIPHPRLSRPLGSSPFFSLPLAASRAERHGWAGPGLDHGGGPPPLRIPRRRHAVAGTIAPELAGVDALAGKQSRRLLATL